jgi:hypothetical protein
MLRAGAVSVVALATAMAVVGAEPATAPAGPSQPADFKVVMTLYGVAKEPVKKIELVVRKGRVFRFDAEPTLEVVILDPAAKKLELVDLDRKIRTELPYKRLDVFQANLQGAIESAIAKREAQGGKANEVAAAMSRDLIEPRYTAEYDPKTRTVRLSNKSVQFEGHGELDTDRPRLALIAEALATMMKLESMREPGTIPPFTRLEALRVMIADHQLRPTEMTYIFRLAGPPRKYRWTFQLEPTLTTREVEGISLIELMRERCRTERFERYERRDQKAEPRKQPGTGVKS